MTRWYLIHTKPAAESTAEENLQRQGYQVYVPRLLRPVEHRGRLCDRIVALFPRYLFLGMVEGRQSLAPVRSSVGVESVVRFGAEYARVPSRVIDDLRGRADPVSGLHRLSTPNREIRPGMPIKVTAGALRGLEGVFERDLGCERVVVLLKFLSQSTRVRLPRGLIVPASVLW